MSNAELSKHGPAHVRPGHRDFQDPAAPQHSHPKFKEPTGNPWQSCQNLPRPLQLWTQDVWRWGHLNCSIISVHIYSLCSDWWEPFPPLLLLFDRHLLDRPKPRLHRWHYWSDMQLHCRRTDLPETYHSIQGAVASGFSHLPQLDKTHITYTETRSLWENTVQTVDEYQILECLCPYGECFLHVVLDRIFQEVERLRV